MHDGDERAKEVVCSDAWLWGSPLIGNKSIFPLFKHQLDQFTPFYFRRLEVQKWETGKIFNMFLAASRLQDLLYYWPRELL